MIDNNITFEEIVSTLMACADDEVTEQEQRYFAALETAETFMQTEEQLTIMDEGGANTTEWNKPTTPCVSYCEGAFSLSQ